VRLDSHTRSKGSVAVRCGAGKGVARCGWLGARDPAGSAVVETACAPVCEGKPQAGFGTAGRCSTICS
jgi:hypothetical protein